MSRIAIICDTHSGSISGLNIPGFADNNDNQKVRYAFYRWAKERIEKNKPFTHVIAAGDLVDGPQKKSNQRGLIIRSLNTQASVAAKIINMFEADTVLMVRGTPYHVLEGDEWESVVLKEVTARRKQIDDHLQCVVDDVIIDVRHFQGAAATYPEREQIDNLIWSLRKDGRHKAAIICRAHRHRYFAMKNAFGEYISIPGLQLHGNPHGDLKCSGQVRTGFIVLDTDKKGGYTWHAEIAELPEAKKTLYRV